MIPNTSNYTVGCHSFQSKEKAFIQKFDDLIEKCDNSKNMLLKRFSTRN